jgi:hypothetical protein
MFQIHCPKGRAVLAVLLLAVLPGGCDAIYDDTKGWAGRLEASLLDAAHGTAEPTPDATAPSRPADALAAARPGEMVPPPAVPVEPVATLALAAPGAQPAALPAAPTEATAPDGRAAPQGIMAAASEALLAGAAEPAAKAAQPAALPPTPRPKPDAPAAAKVADQTADQTAGGAVVAVVLHLSSLRSEAAAKRQWSDLQQSFPVPLGPLQAEFHRTDLGDKGTFYRVLAGPLPSRDEATQVCAALKAKDAKQYCRILPSKPKT